MGERSTVLHLANQQAGALPPEFAGDDVRYTDALVETFVTRYTHPSEVVLDPFAGFGTTLRVAEALGRQPLGLELDERRCAYARTLLAKPEALLCGDARRLASYRLPPVHLSLTSPPYMQREDPTDPLTAYRGPGAGYAAYLSDMREIYRQLAGLLVPGGVAVVEVANLKGPAGVTTLAWDLAAAIGAVLRFEGETIISWDPAYGYGYDHSYCLVFRNAGEGSPSG